MTTDTKPTPMSEQEVVGLVAQLISDIQFVERNVEFAKRRNRLYGRLKVNIPGLTNLQAQYSWPRLRKDANRFKNTILAAPLSYNVNPNSDGPRDAARAQDMQNFNKRHYVRWKDKGSFDGALFDMATMGYGVLHQYINRDVLPIFPDPDDDPEAWLTNADSLIQQFADGERSDLLCVESVLPETVYWNPDMTIRVQASRVPLDPFAAQYARNWQMDADDDENVLVTPIRTTAGGIPLDTGRTVTNRSIVVYIVEDKDYIYHVVFGAQSSFVAPGGLGPIPQLSAGTLLGVYSNPFGTPSFHLIDAERTGDPHALYRTLPLIDGLYDVGPLINIMGTLIEGGAIDAVQNMKIVQALPGPEAADARGNAPAPVISNLNDGFLMVSEGWGVIQNPIRLPTDVLTAYQAMQKEADLYGFPTALAQPQEITASSGYDRAKAQDAVSNLMDPPLEHFGDALNAIFTGNFTAIKNIGFPVSVRNLTPSMRLGGISSDVAKQITIKPEDIIDVDTNVEFDSTTQYAKIASQEEGMKMIEAKVMHPDDFLANVRGIDDIDRYYRGFSISDMRTVARAAAIQDATQAFQQLRAFAQQAAIQSANLKPPVNELAQEAMQQGQQPQGMPPQGPPPGPPAPGNPTGQTAPSIPTGPGDAMPLTPPAPMGGLT